MQNVYYIFLIILIWFIFQPIANATLQSAIWFFFLWISCLQNEVPQNSSVKFWSKCTLFLSISANSMWFIWTKHTTAAATLDGFMGS